MAENRIRQPRRGLSARMRVVKPHTREESEFARAFASALNHATAVIAANPELSVPVGSIAHLVQAAYSRFRPEQHPAIQKRARALLSGPKEQRLRYFGAYADRDVEAWTKAQPGLDRDLKHLLRESVRARLYSQREEIRENLAVGVATHFFRDGPLSKTTLEIGYFSSELVQEGWTTQTIYSPISIELRWETNATGAERGVWQLFRSGMIGQNLVLLGSGKAGNAPGSIFSINLAKYLPAKPPDLPAVYKIRVIPGTNPQTVQKKGQGAPKGIPGKAVGPPSNDVVITYSAGPLPTVEF